MMMGISEQYLPFAGTSKMGCRMEGNWIEISDCTLMITRQDHLVSTGLQK